MSPYQDDMNAKPRRRRTERFAENYVQEDLQSAPQTVSVSGRHGVQPPPPQGEEYPQQPVEHVPVYGYPPVRGAVPEGDMTSYPAQGGYQTGAYPVQNGNYPPQYPAAPYQQPYGWTQPVYPPQQPAQNWQQGAYYTGEQTPWTSTPPHAVEYEGEAPGGYGNTSMPVEAQPMPKPRLGGNGGGGRILKYALLAVAVVLILTAAALGGKQASEVGQLRAAVLPYDSLFCEGVYVDGIHLGGMTQEEAQEAVAKQAENRASSWHVDLMYQGSLVQSITAADLSMTVSVDEALEEAWQQGHASSDLLERKAAMDALIETPYQGFSALPSGNVAVIDSILSQLAAQVYQAPVDAYVKTFVPADRNHPFIIEPEVNGRRLDIEPIKSRLYEMVSSMESGKIDIQPETILASVTTADVQKKVQLRGTGYTPISTTSTENRNNNIRRAFQLITGKIIAPGQTFSFNDVVGKRTAANGFYEAIEYAYGNERMGYGGGVCQASTTIYLAAIRANLEIVKRQPHSAQVGYTEYGRDATVNLDGKAIDLVFRNNTDSNIYVAATVYKDRSLDKDHLLARVDIYGMDMGSGISYDLVTETTEILPAPLEPEIRKDTKAQYVTYTDDQYEYTSAKDGCVVKSYRVKYQNGQEVERTYLYTDTYKARTQVIYVGVTERMLETAEPELYY